MTEKQFNPVNWFQIPVKDMERAVKFYTDVLGFAFEIQKTDDMEMAFFPSKTEAWGCSGMLVRDKWCEPSGSGTRVYFVSPSGDVANEVPKVEKAGGKILQDKISIGEYGFMAVFSDTEGNTVAMHSMK